MKVGYLKKTDAAEVMREYLKKQGAETVIIDNEQREALPELLQSLNPGDALYLFSLWHLSMNTTKVMDILEGLHRKDIMLYVNGEHCDLNDEQTNLELRRVMDYHNETLAAIRDRMESLQTMRDRRREKMKG